MVVEVSTQHTYSLLDTLICSKSEHVYILYFYLLFFFYHDYDSLFYRYDYDYDSLLERYFIDYDYDRYI